MAKQDYPYYVYEHYYEENGQEFIFYVGKGKNKRAWSKRRHIDWINIIHLHSEYKVRFIAYFKKESDSLKFEIDKIAEYRTLKYPLVNKTKCGESSGIPWTIDRRQKIQDTWEQKRLNGFKGHGKGKRAKVKLREIKKFQAYSRKLLGSTSVVWNKGKIDLIPWNKGKKTGKIPWNKGKHTGIGEDNGFFGKNHTYDSKLKMRKPKGKTKISKIITCKYCGKSGRPSLITRHHNNNCKHQ